MGITPSSWKNDMGIFYMMKHIKQDDQDTQLDLYKIKHVVGLELHQSSKSSLNYLTIGGYNPKIVTNPEEIIWTSSYCTKHWEIFLGQIKF